MRLVKFERAGRNAEGVLEGDTVRVLGPWRTGPAALAPFLLAGLAPQQLRAAAAASRETLALDDVVLAVPLDPRNKIICVGANYAEHATEAGIAQHAYPQVFTRSHDSLVAHGQALQLPQASPYFDFEGELALVIGRTAHRVPAATALDHVMGFTCFMDGSVRDFQRQSVTAGKNFWRSGAMGPAIVCADALPDIRQAGLRTRLNGTLVQQARVGHMQHGLEALVAYCASWARLEPGDVIATGTPSGIGARRTPPLWLQHGDAVEVEVDGVGVLRNPVYATA